MADMHQLHRQTALPAKSQAGRTHHAAARMPKTSVFQFARAAKFAAGLGLLLLAATAVAPAQTSPAAAPAASAPAAMAKPAATGPTLDERVSAMEAYFGNTDPSAALAAYKDKDGNLPAKGFTTPASVGNPGPGHNGWMMTSAALVLFMTLPGLALFYGGLVRKKNILSVMAQCLGITGLVSILWWAVGYSLVFGKSFAGSGLGPFIGGSEYFFLHNVTSAPNTDYSAWVSQNVFSMYQMMFAIITPALIVGAIAERMKFSAILVFVTLWMLVVYFPLAHMVWGVSGYMNGVWNPTAKITAMDFAGGTVVHMSSGWSALILCLIIGPRLGFGKTSMPPHSLVLCMIGTGMLWVGWYGFNAGSAVAADVISANAFTTTTMATAVASFTWAMIEYIAKGKPSVLGFCSGAVAGLVVITPACGFVNSTSGAIIIGVLAAALPYLACTKLKPLFKYDDALDTFGVHAVGGTLGALLTGILVDATVNANVQTASPANPATTNGLAASIEHHSAWISQLEAMGITIVLAILGTVVIAFITKAVVGLRPTVEAEEQGLDITDHGEEGYVLE
jgi:Amt family ammonium transporter